jgi:predicted site-specific integrase-resolvase
MSTPTVLLTSAEACERLDNIDRSTLSRWVLTGRITPVQKLPGLRGAFLFEPAEVERVRAELAQQATA